MKPWQQPIGEETEKKIIQYMPCFDNVRLLDFGAGFGRYLNMFSKYIDKKNLFAAEVDDASYTQIIDQGYNCYKPEFTNPLIPFEDNYFNYIFSSNVLEHIPYKYYLKYIEEFYRILKPQGILLFGAPNYPFKRFYDIRKAFLTKQYKYYLLDDPTHCNKLSVLKYEKDFGRYFNKIYLEPTDLFLENRIDYIKRNRYRFRFFCDKIFGYCIKE